MTDSTVPTASDGSVGFAFNNPDLTSDHYAPGWGLLHTPDELRYITMWGNELVAQAQSITYTDENLQYYIDHTIGVIEADLGIDIYPRIVRYNDPVDSISGARIPRVDIPVGEINIREQGYPWRKNYANYYLYTKLRRRPLQTLLSAKLCDPQGRMLMDLFPMRMEKAGLEAVVQFFPHTATPMTGFPFAYGGMTIRYPYENFPEAIKLDYQTGWPSAKDVPLDLRELVRKIAGIMLMQDFADGVTACLASGSVSLNSISESYATTMSAENTMFGARVLSFRNDIKEWKKNNYWRYKRSIMGVV